jgi:hypothetical protein
MMGMKFYQHNLEGGGTAVEVISDEVLIHSEQEALDLMVDIGYQFECRKIILHKPNLSEDFFDLKTGLAGGVLQKFSNYQVQLAIIGNFSSLNSKSLGDFILESNRNRHILFVKDVPEALNILKK